MTTTRPRPRWHKWAAAAVAAVALLALSAAALNRAPAPVSTASGTTSQASGSSSSTLNLESTDGQAVNVPGEKPTVLLFMASWCTSCIEPARALSALEDEFADTATFVAVETTPNVASEDLDRFQTAADNPTHPYVVDTRGELVERYEVTALDTTVVVGTDGTVLARADGRPLDEAALKAFLDDTLS